MVTATPTSKSASHTFFLEIDPFPAERTKCACRGRFPTVYAPGNYKEWLAAVVDQLNLVAAGQDLSAFRDAPVSINLEVIRERPKTTKLFAPLGDNDNFEKGFWDAISKAGHWWSDDRQIVHNETWKRWTWPGEKPGYRVTIRTVSEEPFSR